MAETIKTIRNTVYQHQRMSSLAGGFPVTALVVDKLSNCQAATASISASASRSAITSSNAEIAC